mgnify:CR=1 FL=1
MEEMTIRVATVADQAAICRIHLQAFEADERDQVASLAMRLLTRESQPRTLNLVADSAGELWGHVAFSPVWSTAVDQMVLGYILAPLAVSPAGQGKGLGSQLVRAGLQQLTVQAIPSVLVYGDPRYYGRFGFAAQSAESFPPPFPLKFPEGWQALHLCPDSVDHSAQPFSCVDALNRPELW